MGKESLALLGLLCAASQASAQEPSSAETPEAELEGTLPAHVVKAVDPAPQPPPVPQLAPVTEAEEEPEPLVLDDSIYQSKRVTSTKYTQPILDIP